MSNLVLPPMTSLSGDQTLEIARRLWMAYWKGLDPSSPAENFTLERFRKLPLGSQIIWGEVALAALETVYALQDKPP